MLGGKNSVRRNLLALLVASPWLLVALVRLFALDGAWPAIPLVAFTPQTMVTLLVPLVVAVVLRARWTALVIVLTIGALAVVVAPRLTADDQPTAEGPVVRVLTANLLEGAAEGRSLVAAIRSSRADIIALQEASAVNIAALREAGVLKTHPYTAENSADALLANITLSRWPLRGGRETYFETGRWPTLHVVGRGVDFFNFHARSPTTPQRTDQWKAALASLPRGRAGGSGGVGGSGSAGGSSGVGGSARARLPLIAGDFNATVDHRAFRELLAGGYVDAGSVTGNGLDWTWSIGRLTRLVIDHVLVPSGVRVLRYRVIDIPGSDHNAVAVTLRLPE